MSELKQKTLKGIVWSAAERFSVQGLQFLLGIILARLLLPSDYGLIGMLAIFLAISQTFIDSGFSSALIQKKDRTDVDFNTTFYFNLAIAIFIYTCLALAAPLIATFYKEPLLTSVTRVIGLNIVISSFAIVQRSKLTIRLDFKTQAKASLIAVLIGGSVGIILAFKGFGVWALVFQTLTRNLFNTIFLWCFSKWQPKREFSIDSFKTLFSFGSKLLGAGLLNTIFQNIYQMIIGKLYNAESLGFYVRAKQFQRLPSQNITEILQRVTYPVLSSIQDNESKLHNTYRKLIKLSAFTIFPLMMGLFAIAKPMIRLILTDKWLPAAPLLQILCIAGMLYPIQAINLNILKVKGRSDLFLKLEIIKKAIISVVILATFSFGVKALVIGQIVTSIIAFFINTHYTGKLADYSTWDQIKDIFPILIISAIMSISILVINHFVFQDWIKLIVGISCGMIIYLSFAVVGKFEELVEIKKMIYKGNNEN